MTDALSAKEVVRLLDLAPHPEGGFYRQTFRDSRTIDGTRGASTAIYYLLPEGEVSAWHRVVDAAEVWHYYAGAALDLVLSEDGVTAPSSSPRTRHRGGRASTVHCPRRRLAVGQKPGLLDAGRLHCGAGFRIRGV